MEVYTEPKKRFETLFELFEQSLNGQKEKPLHAYRKMALERFAALDFPTLRHEDWKYTSVSRILQPKYSINKAVDSRSSDIIQTPEENAIRVNITNGSWALDSSIALPTGLHILSWQEATENERFSALLHKHILDETSIQDKVFTQLNLSFLRKGLMIVVEKNAVIEPSLYLSIQSGLQTEPEFHNLSVLICMEEGASLHVTEHYQSATLQGNEDFTNVFQKVVLARNSQLTQYKIQTLDPSAYMIYTVEVDQKRDSVYTHFNIDAGSRMVRNNLSCVQSEPNVCSNLYGINLGAGEQHADTQTTIDHAHPHGLSNELYRSLLNDRARGVFNGKVLVRQDAQKINAYQQNDTLLLSEKARSDAKPQLEIFADDVRCSHGATIGRLNESQIFYLMSRGLDRREAERILQWAFIGKVSEHIDREPIREYVEQILNTKLHSGNHA